jgi:pyrroloquinoline quinone biosynthesis protein B
VSDDGTRWWLCNASPDVREQIARLPTSRPAGVRHVPIEGVVLTDAELDHTLGLALLREGRRLTVWATDGVRATLECDSRLLPVTRAFADVCVRPLPIEAPVPLLDRDGTESALLLEAFPVAGDPPRFASVDGEGHTVGLLISDRATGRTCAFVPGCGVLDEPVLRRLGAADAVLCDGTFWRDDELVALGIGKATAREMGHVPISGTNGSLARLAALPARTKVYTHLNNTNPALDEASVERRAIVEMGMQVGEDGMRFEL